MINLSFNFNLFNSYYYFYERLLVILFSVVPTIFLVCFVLYTDKKNKEPSKNIIICLLSGILTISVAGYLEGLVMPYFSNNIVLTYVWAFIEELSKLAIFLLFIFDNKHYDDIYDGIVYMTLIALSFAGLENIMYAFSESTITSSISLALMRDFTTIPLHVICGILIGHYISLSTFSKDNNKKYINFFKAILISSLIHGTYNVLMGILGNININHSNYLMVIIFEIIPLLIIMIILFYIAYKFSRENIKLNKVFMKDGVYEKKYSYLMNKDEYLKSHTRLRRIKLYDKTNLIKKDDAK